MLSGASLNQFIDIDLVEGLVEVLLRPSFKELGLDLGIVDFGNCYRAELVEVAVANLAVKYDLTCYHVHSVDMPENIEIFAAVAQGKVIESV